MLWESFFSCQRSPVLRSQLLACLMAGQVLEVERLPAAALPDACLIATAAREYHEAEVVDDYARLLTRTDEVWRQSDWTCRTFDSPHLSWLDFILKGLREFDDPTERYIPDFVAWALGQEVPVYFKKELVK